MHRILATATVSAALLVGCSKGDAPATGPASDPPVEVGPAGRGSVEAGPTGRWPGRTAPSLTVPPAPAASEPKAVEVGPASRWPALVRSRYAWLEDDSLSYPEPVEPLEARFPAPEGYVRVSLEDESFGAWLRGLPLARSDTPVRTHRGRILHPHGDPRVAAVVAIDVGSADLQQCADAILRLHAEWRWHAGHRDMTYQSASGVPLSLGRWLRGERLSVDGATLRWQPTGRPGDPDDHASFRTFMNQVFAWANTVSLERQATEVPLTRLAPGDFVVLPGNPGHAVIVLDLARSAAGAYRALLGQSFMPAQNVHVLSRDGHAWFPIDPAKPLRTPFWRPFPWTTLRRLRDEAPAKNGNGAKNG